MESLFAAQTHTPLAHRLRPHRLDEVIGQSRLLGPDGQLTAMLRQPHLPSLIFWGPPGVGKTTIARLLAEVKGYEFMQISAVYSGVADLKKAFETARQHKTAGKQTLLFVDEIHRFNKAQQDGFLPYVEDGTVILVGATTENPSFELNRALLSRCQVLVLEALTMEDMETLLSRAESHEKRKLPLTPEARQALIARAEGDGRYLLNLAEILLAHKTEKPLGTDDLAKLLSQRAAHYDKTGEQHYNLISALHKSMRGSDPDAALYWFCRMLEGGEHPEYIARRLLRFAWEDIGLADPQAATQAMAAWQTYERLGTPEGELALAACVIYLSTAPKSNAVYKAYGAARRAAAGSSHLNPPAHILNAPTALMKDLGYGKGYEYDHDTAGGFSGQNYFPESMERPVFYAPKGLGVEEEIKARLEEWAARRRQKKAS